MKTTKKTKPMKTSIKYLTTSVLASLAFVVSANAAVVNWQTPVAITGDTDVATTGTLVGAFIPGANALATTVNGVAFTTVFVANQYDNTTTTSLAFGSVATLAGNLGLYGFNQYESGTPSGLSTDYTKVFSGGVGPATQTNYVTLTLTNLTIGQEYLFQSWVNDSRAVQSTRTQTIYGNNLSGSQSGVLDYNLSNLDGGTGSFVIGTFTADATSQAMLYSSPDYAQISAFQVRAVPEPSSMLIGGIGSLFFFRRRRAA
jgi:hypothetical protein